MSSNLSAEVAIVGAGLVGLAAAVAFAHQGKRVVLLDAKKPQVKSAVKLKKAWDERVYALTPESESWLKSIGVWAFVDVSRVSPIHAMHIVDDVNEQNLILRAEDANLPKLGVIVENQNLIHALNQQISALDVTVITEATCQTLNNSQQDIVLGLEDGRQVAAKLMVAADGVNSWVRNQANIGITRKDFYQTAVVANFKTEKPHGGVARQWFAPHDVLALLPLPDNTVSIVWSVSTEKAAQLLNSEQLAQSVLAKTKGELGDLKLVGKTQSFALNQQTATQFIAERIVLVGDAAHQIHPMAGQGMNLGLRDVRQLQAVLTNTHAMQDIGETAFLRNYERARQADVATMNTLTTGLDALFASESEVLKNMTGWGLKQLNRQTILKKLLIQQAA